LFLVLLCAAVLFACGERERTANLYHSGTADVARSRPRLGYDAEGRPAPTALNAVVVTSVEDALPPISRDVTNMVIRTATASIEVDSLQPAVAQLKQLAARMGGYVANSNMETGKSQLRQAEIEVKIPANRFDEALSGLSPIGKLESVDIEAQDVGEEFVDVNARMDNARRLERRLIDLLATRTGKLKDVLDVEQALARVREEIERYEGRIRYLQAHAAVSTLTVTVHEPVPVVGTAGKSVMGEAFAQSWRNFVVLLSLAVQSLGVVLPLGFVAAVAWAMTRRWRVAKQKAA